MIHLSRVRTRVFVCEGDVVVNKWRAFSPDEANDWPARDGTYDAAGATEASQSDVAAASIRALSKGQRGHAKRRIDPYYQYRYSGTGGIFVDRRKEHIAFLLSLFSWTLKKIRISRHVSHCYEFDLLASTLLSTSLVFNLRDVTS